MINWIIKKEDIVTKTDILEVNKEYEIVSGKCPTLPLNIPIGIINSDNNNVAIGKILVKEGQKYIKIISLNDSHERQED